MIVRTFSSSDTDDVGNFSYGFGHPMKPHRMRMAHNLIVNYGLDKKMTVLVCNGLGETNEASSPCHAQANDQVSHGRVHRLSESHHARNGTRSHRRRHAMCVGVNGVLTTDLIGEDCPAFDGLFEFCSISCGGSICTRGAPHS